LIVYIASSSTSPYAQAMSSPLIMWLAVVGCHFAPLPVL
jgi:hypothetical protein